MGKGVEIKKSPQKNTKSPVKREVETKLGQKQSPAKKEGCSAIITCDADTDPDFEPPVKISMKKSKAKSSVSKSKRAVPKHVVKPSPSNREKKSAITCDAESDTDSEPPVKVRSKKGRRRLSLGKRVRKPPEDQKD